MMFADFLCDTVSILWKATAVYEDGLSLSKYEDPVEEMGRISSLNYKDLQFLDKVEGVAIGVAKLHMLPDTTLQLKDQVEIEGKKYQVFSEYAVKGRKTVHHKKFYIKIVEDGHLSDQGSGQAPEESE